MSPSSSATPPHQGLGHLPSGLALGDDVRVAKSGTRTLLGLHHFSQAAPPPNFPYGLSQNSVHSYSTLTSTEETQLQANIPFPPLSLIQGREGNRNRGVPVCIVRKGCKTDLDLKSVLTRIVICRCWKKNTRLVLILFLKQPPQCPFSYQVGGLVRKSCLFYSHCGRPKALALSLPVASVHSFCPWKADQEATTLGFFE